MSSFDFTWSNANKPTGAVFARKRPNKKIVDKPAEKTVKTSPKIQKSALNNLTTVKKPEPIRQVAENVENPHISSEKPETSQKEGYVKRKQRKDKQKGEPSTSNQNSTKTYSLFKNQHKEIFIDANIPGKSLVETVFHEKQNFHDLGLHNYLVSNLEKAGFTKLTNVQSKAIPVILTGKDLLVRSQTGSGKTLTFTIPILNALQSINPHLKRYDGVQALIIVPTRELALQIHEEFNKINTFQWIVLGHLCGGENRKTEKERLRKGCHVLIGTPGRLLDHILHTQAFKLNNIRCLVLDEADRLLDMGFKKDIEKIVTEIDRAKNNADYDPMAMLKGDSKPENVEDLCDESPLLNVNSKKRQTIFLSATLNKNLAELADFAMREHVYVDALDGNNSAMNSSKNMIIPNTVKQEFILTYIKHRLFTLSALLMSLVDRKVFVFMATSQMVEYHYELFRRCLKCELYKLHGSMEQNERKGVFGAFRKAQNGILLCTDVVARGIDVPEADCIIQYTGPQSDQDYLHRVGRTGRAGKSGSAIIFLTHEEQEYVRRLQDHKVFLKKKEPNSFMPYLCEFTEESDEEMAATAMQKIYEETVEEDRNLHRMACFAYSSWSRFYNAYPANMRDVFNFKRINLGQYVTSFALRETPSSIARIVKGQVTHKEPKRFNQKLDTHSDDQKVVKKTVKRKIKSISLSTSEFSSGLEPSKKKKKKTL